MKSKIFCLMAMAIALTCNSASAQLDIVFSTSDSDANAGTVLDLVLGDSGSMYVWLTNNDVDAVDGVGIDLLSSELSVLQATAHTVANPDSRWQAAEGGDLGDLATDSVSFALIGLGTNGIVNDGTAVLYSTIDFDATGLGSTDLTIVENSNAISVLGNSANSINFGGATVNVSAIPEPGSVAVLALVAGVAGLRRRRQG